MHIACKCCINVLMLTEHTCMAIYFQVPGISQGDIFTYNVTEKGQEGKMIILIRDCWTLYQICMVGKEINIGSRLLLYNAFKFIFQGEHNATYTVSKSDTGLKFQKIRHKHPVSNARASYVKVKVNNFLICLIFCIWVILVWL